MLTVRVGGTVITPARPGMRYTMRDWLLKPIAPGTVGKDGRFVIHAEQPVFVVHLER